MCNIKRHFLLQHSSAAFFIKLLHVAHYVIYIDLAHFANYHHCWRQYYPLNCWKRFPYIINLTASNSGCALIKNYLKDESSDFLLSLMRLLIINEEFKAQFMLGTEFTYSPQVNKSQYWLRIFQNIRVTPGHKKYHVFWCGNVRLPHGLSSCLIWSCYVRLSSGVPSDSWWKHKRSSCQGRTEVFVVAAASAGHMSKGSVWINDFSRGW